MLPYMEEDSWLFKRHQRKHQSKHEGRFTHRLNLASLPHALAHVLHVWGTFIFSFNFITWILKYLGLSSRFFNFFYLSFFLLLSLYSFDFYLFYSLLDFFHWFFFRFFLSISSFNFGLIATWTS
jgi:hypothetical protein